MIWRIKYLYRGLLWRSEFFARLDQRLRGYEVISIGDKYEDCAYRILTCTRISYSTDLLYGTDENGKEWGCSPTMCGVVKQ